MNEIIMPQVGQDIPTAEILAWHKQVGDHVEEGELLLEVQSDKADFDVEAEASGVLLKILHFEGEEVEVFKTIGLIGEAGEEVTEEQPKEDPPSSRTDQTGPGAQVIPPSVSARPKRVAASPAARRLASERGIDLAEITGSGEGGRIVQDDVQIKIDAGVTKGGEGAFVPFSTRRQRIAKQMTQSKRMAPHFYLFADVDMTSAVGLRKQQAVGNGHALSYTDIIVGAVARALAEFPRLNAHVNEQGIVMNSSVNIGVAVSVEDGVLAPVIPDADRKTLSEVAALSERLAKSAREGKMAPGPASTFTVTSLGMHGISRFIPIINPPECAILAVGAIEKRVVPDAEYSVRVRDMMSLTLAVDHRATDGVEAGRFLNRVAELLENVAEFMGGVV